MSLQHQVAQLNQISQIDFLQQCLFSLETKQCDKIQHKQPQNSD